jgi:hypothetical protein
VRAGVGSAQEQLNAAAELAAADRLFRALAVGVRRLGFYDSAVSAGNTCARHPERFARHHRGLSYTVWRAVGLCGAHTGGSRRHCWHWWKLW